MSKILITSALPYINGVKHLGNLVGSLLPADVHARFRRQVGDEVLFICGTDEHGTPAELGAIEAGEDVRHYCDAQHAIQADIYRRFGLSFDHFGRSSCRQNHALTQHFYARLDAAGLIVALLLGQAYGIKIGHTLGLYAGSMTSTATLQAALDGERVVLRPVVLLLDPGEQEHLVVHGEPEGDAEHQDRDRAAGE